MEPLEKQIQDQFSDQLANQQNQMLFEEQHAEIILKQKMFEQQKQQLERQCQEILQQQTELSTQQGALNQLELELNQQQELTLGDNNWDESNQQTETGSELQMQLEQEPNYEKKRLDQGTECSEVHLISGLSSKDQPLETIQGHSGHQAVQQDEIQPGQSEPPLLKKKKTDSKLNLSSLIQHYRAFRARNKKKRRMQKRNANRDTEEQSAGMDKQEDERPTQKHENIDKNQHEGVEDDEKVVDKSQQQDAQESEHQKEQEEKERKRIELQEIERMYRELSSGEMLRDGKIMQLFLDQVDGEFFLLDGDSLLMEAACTVGWRFGQQLHLFYIVESVLRLLSDHGGCCWASFMEDLGNSAWRDQPVMQLFRRALQLHLQASCSVQVVSGIESCWDQKFLDLLKKRPQFLMLRNGLNMNKDAVSASEIRSHLKLLSYCTLAHNVPFVYINEIFLQDMKIYGLWTERRMEYKSKHFFERFLKNRPRLRQRKVKSEHVPIPRKDSSQLNLANFDVQKATINNQEGMKPNHTPIEESIIDDNNVRGAASAPDKCNTANELNEKKSKETSGKANSAPDTLEPLVYTISEKQQLRDWLAVETGRTFLAKSPENVETASLWCLYFASMSVMTYNERIRLVDDEHYLRRKHETENQPVEGCKEEGLMIETLQSLDQLASSILITLSSLTDLSGFSDPHSVSDLIDIFVYQRFGEIWKDAQLSLQVHPRAQMIRDRYEKYSNQLQYSLLDLPMTQTGLDIPLLFNRSEESRRPTLHSVRNCFVDEFAGELLENLSKRSLIVTSDPGTNQETKRRIFDERRHWHNRRPLKDDLDEERDTENPGNFISVQRPNQGLKNHLKMYGASLHSEGSEAVVVPGSESRCRISIIERHRRTENDNDIEMQNLRMRWRVLRSRFKFNSMTPVEAIQETIQAIKTFSAPGRIFEEPVLFVIEQQYNLWKTCCTGDEDVAKSYSVLADLVHTLHKYSTEPLVNLISQDLRVAIAKYFLMIGFKDAKLVTDVGLKKLKKVEINEQCLCPMSYQEFQMLHMGHLMQRNVRFDPDPRVRGFIPDTWQRELLDVVDRRESAVIVAPTSSGKTYCSYYCMKKVLEMSDETIVVYVAPTKALVNQVHASLNAKLLKPGLTPGKELCGVFTRDYTYMVDNCQILITVPQCLEILLMSPRRQGFANRIQYVIFDEVHCIGTNIGGVVWEYLICLIRCPFLALSATIRNKEYFHEWLQTVKSFIQRQDEARGSAGTSYKVNLVTYSERYSDIRTSLYLPSRDEIVEVNPCVFLRDTLLKKNGFPNNLNLSPKESHQLWSAAMECFKDDEKVLSDLENFRPETYFDKSPISRSIFRQYEISLKQRLSQILHADATSKTKELLVTLMRRSEAPRPEDLTAVDVDENFPLLIDILNSRNLLPALVFMNSRSGIKNLSEVLLFEVLKKIQVSNLTDVFAPMQSTRSHENLLRESSSSSDESDSSSQELKVNYLDLLARRKELVDFAYFSPDSAFSEEVEEVFQKVVSKIEDEDVKVMLTLGVGYHHAGCTTKHRQAVEMLFRYGYLRVVASTATLALGIHMPCKTVVFASDDKYLDALNYHQMSGRSGRRGFDNVGDVVFYGVPAHKISHLIHADLTELRGGFPMTCAFALRLLLLTGNATDPEIAHLRAMTVLNHPFAGHQRRSVMEQLKLYFLFSLDFLSRQELISKEGLPQELAGLVSHIGYQLPGNFVLAYLLRTNAFRELCQPIKPDASAKNVFVCRARVPKVQFSKKTMCTLVLILARLFTNYPLPKPLIDFIRLLPESDLSDEDENSVDSEEESESSDEDDLTSMILLDPLPQAIEEAVDEYNEQTVDTYINYLKCVTGSGLLKFSRRLPMSKAAPLGDDEDAGSCSGFSAVSPLTRLSIGSGISSAEDVLRQALLSSDSRDQLRRVLPLEILTDDCLIPMLPTQRFINAFALDFFIHSSTEILSAQNRVRGGEDYQLLLDFLLVIKAVTTVLEQLAVDPNDLVVLAFRQLSAEYKAKFETAFKMRLRWRC